MEQKVQKQFKKVSKTFSKQPHTVCKLHRTACALQNGLHLLSCLISKFSNITKHLNLDRPMHDGVPKWTVCRSQTFIKPVFSCSPGLYYLILWLLWNENKKVKWISLPLCKCLLICKISCYFGCLPENGALMRLYQWEMAQEDDGMFFSPEEAGKDKWARFSAENKHDQW